MEDAKIIDLFWARNEDAIRETHTAYGRKLYVLANRILNNREDAEESVNDTYMKTWEIIPPQRPNYFYAFLASICRHLSFHKVDWKLAAKRNAEIVTLTEEMELCIPDTSRERELEAKELGRVLDAFLESLPKETRLIFLRRYWHVDTIAEIAARYGITESKVKMQLSRTRAKLCTYLEQEGIKV
ncbi:MAG: RNA polymerase sigma factor [Faecousia sp.]